MVNRILLNTEALKISKPGFDVLAASELNLQFNSKYNGLGIRAKGAVTTNGSVATVYYPKIFAAVPHIDIYYSCPDLYGSQWVASASQYWPHTLGAAGEWFDVTANTQYMQFYSQLAGYLTYWVYVVWSL